VRTTLDILRQANGRNGVVSQALRRAIDFCNGLRESIMIHGGPESRVLTAWTERGERAEALRLEAERYRRLLAKLSAPQKETKSAANRA